MSAEDSQPPENLYRGIIIPIEDAGEHLFNDPVNPGGDPFYNEDGQPVVLDGNEYGVYMSDNAHMVEQAYATPRHGQPIPDGPTFNHRGDFRSQLTGPKLGVIYKVKSDGINARKPQINGPMKGLYNNGYQGDEWIAETIPPANHEITKFKVGRDSLHDPLDIEVEGDPEAALEKVRLEAEQRARRLVDAAHAISDMPPDHLKNSYRVGKVLEEHKQSRF